MYILTCTDGLKIYKFVEEKVGSASKVIIKPTEWTIPIKTDDMDKVELASRVKFESISVIRFLTRDKRDILYKLDADGKNVHYMGECRVDNVMKTEKHKLVYNEYEDEFDRLKQKSYQVKASTRHRRNLKYENLESGKELHTDLKRFDLETDVKMHVNGEGFTTNLSFIPFEWYLAEKIVANEA